MKSYDAIQSIKKDADHKIIAGKTFLQSGCTVKSETILRCLFSREIIFQMLYKTVALLQIIKYIDFKEKKETDLFKNNLKLC